MCCFVVSSIIASESGSIGQMKLSTGIGDQRLGGSTRQCAIRTDLNKYTVVVVVKMMTHRSVVGGCVCRTFASLSAISLYDLYRESKEVKLNQSGRLYYCE
jgi:hypothetical protein